LNVTRARQLLREPNFRSLFIEELGWDRHNATPDVTVQGVPVSLSAIAHKRGMVAYHCPTPNGQPLPNHAYRRKIEHQVAKSAREHLIIFTDQDQSTQIWQWVKREPGKPAACREHTYDRSQPGDALLQKLDSIAFSLKEEEQLTLTDVTSRARAGFDVERVRRFYDRFQKEHAAFLNFIAGITEAADCEWYASVMLNRLMFVYFIQRNGFLDGDRDYLRNRLNRMRKEYGHDKFYSFYRYFLLRLFHEGLGGPEHSAELEKLLGRIPYLNGGLFDIHELEQPDRYGTSIEIPDTAFESVFNCFGQFRWHLDERPRRADNEINPDVLGYVFEKYVNQKQMGAYYTKEDITEYIGKNTVIPFLFDAARAKCRIAFENPSASAVWDLLPNDPDRYIYPAVRHGITWKYDATHPQRGVPLEKPFELPDEIGVGLNPPTLHQPVGEGPVLTLELRKHWNRPAPPDSGLPTETWREVIARRKRYEEVRAKLAGGEVRDINDLVTLNLDICQFAQDAIENCESPELLRAFWHAIARVTILDPTCGSGAFLFAALNILEPLYEACLGRMEAFVVDLARSGEKHRPEKYADFRKVLANVAVHPNRRYFILKSIILNNLFGVDIMEEAVEICKLRLFLKLAAQVEPDAAAENFGIEPLPDIDFNIRPGNALVGYANYDEVKKAIMCKLDLANAMEKIAVKAADLQQTFDTFRQRQIEGDGSVPAEHKQELRQRLKALDEELNRHLAAEYGVKADANAAYAKWLKSHQPFHWFVEFYGIMERGGFDVVIGNPPWVELAKVRDRYVPKGLYTLDCNNLWAFVVERSLSILLKSGAIGLIVPMSLVCTERMRTIQRRVASCGHVWLANFESDSNPGQLFDGVKQNVTIFLGCRSSSCEVYTTKLLRYFQEFRDCVFPLVEFALLDRGFPIQFGFAKVSTPIELRVLSILFSKPRLAAMKSMDIGEPILVHRIAHYYIKCFDFVPFFRSDRDGVKKSEDYKEYFFAPPTEPVVAAINSSAFYLYWQAFFDAFKAGKLCVESFPLGDTRALKVQGELVKLAKDLMCDMNANATRLRAEYRATGQVEYDQFYPRKSKHLMDEIDRILARHYGFTEEELDFIINYDIKYRLGGNSATEDE
jgi:hypothetical protein